jgi:hypothetical protein
VPYSPLAYTKDVFKDLKKHGYENRVSTMALHNAIIRQTRLIKSATIARVVQVYEQLGYIIPDGTGANLWSIDWKKVKEAK